MNVLKIALLAVTFAVPSLALAKKSCAEKYQECRFDRDEVAARCVVDKLTCDAKKKARNAYKAKHPSTTFGSPVVITPAFTIEKCEDAFDSCRSSDKVPAVCVNERNICLAKTKLYNAN